MDLWREEYRPRSMTVSSSGIVYDPYLGDRLYSLNQWKKALANKQLDLEILETGLTTFRQKPYGGKLVHFILTKKI